MNPKLLRLALAAALFAAWMGYLGYLVYTLPRPSDNPNRLPVVLSRPQFLVSEFDVVGTIDVKAGTVKVDRVLYPRDAEKPADDIKVTNLSEVHPALPDAGTVGPCLLLLQEADDGMYQIAPLPPSPGYRSDGVRLYPADAETLAAYRSLEKPKRRDEHPSS